MPITPGNRSLGDADHRPCGAMFGERARLRVVLGKGAARAQVGGRDAVVESEAGVSIPSWKPAVAGGAHACAVSRAASAAISLLAAGHVTVVHIMVAGLSPRCSVPDCSARRLITQGSFRRAPAQAAQRRHSGAVSGRQLGCTSRWIGVHYWCHCHCCGVHAARLPARRRVPRHCPGVGGGGGGGGNQRGLLHCVHRGHRLYSAVLLRRFGAE
mmetsp:Transcript_15922/g.39122  ORF Transcript_15922/g.39122 Transcript_15922/m.39122 type:complete len:213 (+) Transcript_15922:818-1456(+)